MFTTGGGEELIKDGQSTSTSWLSWLQPELYGENIKRYETDWVLTIEIIDILILLISIILTSVPHSTFFINEPSGWYPYTHSSLVTLVHGTMASTCVFHLCDLCIFHL